MDPNVNFIPCETCGVMATEYAQDMQEVEPRADGNGQTWRTWKAGKTHYYCREHYKPGTATLLDGTVEEHPPRERS